MSRGAGPRAGAPVNFYWGTGTSSCVGKWDLFPQSGPRIASVEERDLSKIDRHRSFIHSPPAILIPSFLGLASRPESRTMVEIEAVDEQMEDQQKQQVEDAPAAAADDSAASASHERILDAAAIESLFDAPAVTQRPAAKAQLEALAKKLRRDAAALQRLEESRSKMKQVLEVTGDAATAPTPPATAATSTATATTTVVPPPEPPRPIPVAVAPAVASSSQQQQHFIPVDKYAFDAGSYNSPTVSVYVPLPNVGSAISRDSITCTFTITSFDLIVRDLHGKSYRLLNDNLEHDIDPEKSKHLVKADKIVLKLGKTKTDYGSYEHWTQLTAKKDKKKKAAERDNPAAGIMDLMKQMYDEGDDNMKSEYE